MVTVNQSNQTISYARNKLINKFINIIHNHGKWQLNVHLVSLQ